jgi:membrane protease YdiL (CAAX protease family)
LGDLYLSNLIADIRRCSHGVLSRLLGFKKPARRLPDSVLLPVGASLLANLIVAFFWFREIGEPAYFVTQMHGVSQLWQPHILLTLAVNLGIGFQFASIGFILIAAFFVLYSWGRTTLPIHLPETSSFAALSSEDEHRRSVLFVWIMVAMIFLAWVPEIASAALVNWIFPRLTRSHPAWASSVGELLDAISLLVFVVLVIGKSGRNTIPAMLRIPRAKYLATAILIPWAIAYVWPFASYLHARMLWTVHGWGKYVPPSPSSFFGLPSVSSVWFFVPALAEEIAWRGYLQPRFIRRYGLFRGIFLVGVVWGAFHYFGDFNSHMTVQEVGTGLVGRLAGTISFSYVLAWLTIRSESILPAAVAHAIYNAFITSRSLPVHTNLWLMFLLWVATGFVLFHFFPPPSPTTVAESAIPPAPEPEPSEV